MTPPDPVPTAEDYWRAGLLISGAGGQLAPELHDLFAGGIAVARAGGDVLDYLRRQLDEPPANHGCAGHHVHYAGTGGANVWSVYNGAGHPLPASFASLADAGARTPDDGRLFTHTHAECVRFIADGGVPL